MIQLTPQMRILVALSPLVPLARAVRYAQCNLHEFAGSLAAPATLLNCIALGVGARLGRAALARLREFEASAQAGKIYRPEHDRDP